MTKATVTLTEPELARMLWNAMCEASEEGPTPTYESAERLAAQVFANRA